MSTLRKRFRRGTAEAGDLALIEEADGWFAAVIVERGWWSMRVSWGDCERSVEVGTTPCVLKRQMHPSAGECIGQKYPTLESLLDFFDQHRRPGIASWRESAGAPCA